MNTTHTKIRNIIKKDGSFDAHMWIENDGKIMDYPLAAYKGLSLGTGSNWTGKCIYKPFPKNIEKLLKNKMIAAAKIKIKETETLMEVFGSGAIKKKAVQKFKLYCITNAGFCNIRAMLMAEKMLNKQIVANIRCGSLGFVQKNGDVWYEYG